MGKSGNDTELNEVVLDSYSNEFPLTTQTLSKLVDPKNPDLLRELGGLEGVAGSLRSNSKNGLPIEQNDTELHRVEKYGKNVLPPAPLKSMFSIIFEALQDQVLLLLIGAAVISIVLGSLKWTAQDPKVDWIEGVAILIAVVIVVTVTSGNDYQKQKQFRKLDAKKSDRQVNVVRGGEQSQISVFDVKVGDKLILDTGDIICADGIFIDGYAIKCDESAFTGEADAIKKGKMEDGLDPFFLSGSQVLEGFGQMLVIAVGPNSFNGKIMMSLNVPDEETPLQEKLEVLANNIGKFGLGAAVLLLLIAIPKYLIIHRNSLSGSTVSVLVKYIINAITIVVVAVPEGLPLAVTMALAYGTLKMFKENNLVRHLAACETMADATNICSDKTGTLTMNQMTVVTGWVTGKTYKEHEFEHVDNEVQGFVRQVLCDGIAVNSTAFEGTNAKGRTEFIGSKTECALLGWTKKLGSSYDAIRKNTKIKQLYPFSSARKRMSVLTELDSGNEGDSGASLIMQNNPRYRLYCKGASEIVLGMCDRILSHDGKVYHMSDEVRKEVDSAITSFATDALRTIALAYTDLEGDRDWEIPPEQNLILISIVGIRDPVRPEVPNAVAVCQRAGIIVRMVTGDNITTAENIAKKCGILTEGGICMEGPKFRELAQHEMDAILPNLQVLARSSPLDKQTLVGRLQELGEVVAVTGDGTNDGPALKLADIGFSMGISGTEVAIAASDVVLLDDNFASIVVAVLWGRNIFDAIRKFLQFQITVNIVAVTIAFIGSITSDQTSPLGSIELLWVNLIMDTLAALALATEKPTQSLLERQPNHREEPLINRVMWRNIVVQASFQLIVCFVVLYAGDKIWNVVKGGGVHYTLLFNIFVFLQVFNEINSRELGNRLNVFRDLNKSFLFIVVMVVTLIIQIIFVELGGQYTGCTRLSWDLWLESIAIGAVSLPIGLLQRFIPIQEKELPPRMMMVKNAGQNGLIIMPKTEIAENMIEPRRENEPEELFIVKSPKLDQDQEPFLESSPLHLTERRARGRGRGWEIVRQTRTKIAVVNAFKGLSRSYKDENSIIGIVRGYHRS